VGRDQTPACCSSWQRPLFSRTPLRSFRCAVSAGQAGKCPGHNNTGTRRPLYQSSPAVRRAKGGIGGSGPGHMLLPLTARSVDMSGRTARE
jgi:hypothetical protein